eukprot:6024462-Prymnesium_polylepis.2
MQPHEREHLVAHHAQLHGEAAAWEVAHGDWDAHERSARRALVRRHAHSLVSRPPHLSVDAEHTHRQRLLTALRAAHNLRRAREGVALLVDELILAHRDPDVRHEAVGALRSLEASETARATSARVLSDPGVERPTRRRALEALT